jgi:hypothetical protein
MEQKVRGKRRQSEREVLEEVWITCCGRTWDGSWDYVKEVDEGLAIRRSRMT